MPETELPSSEKAEWYRFTQDPSSCEWIEWPVRVEFSRLQDAIRCETEQALCNPERIKSEGNELCRLKKWHEALGKYTQAFALDLLWGRSAKGEALLFAEQSLPLLTLRNCLMH